MCRIRDDFRETGRSCDFRLSCIARNSGLRPSVKGHGQMGDDKRLHRRDPERTGPIRSFIETYVARPPARELEQTAESSAAAATPMGTQPQGIDLAYQVIDKHIN